MNGNDNKKSSKSRKPPNRPGGFKRRNSTTVSSIKIKKPPKDSVKSPTSFDHGDEGPPLSPKTPSETPSVERIGPIFLSNFETKTLTNVL